MRPHWLKLTGAGMLAFALNGCPVTDDYYIDATLAGSGTSNGGKSSDGGADSLPQAGTATHGGGGADAGTAGSGATSNGGSTSGGTATAGTSATGGKGMLPEGGAPEASGGAPDLGSAGQGGSPSEPCVPTTERCNGHDDNCNEVVDEQACNSSQNGTTGCSGFVLSGSPNHGYMLCTGTLRDYSHAQEACAGQGMRLAWLESSAENSEVSTKVNSVSKDAEVYIGANDIANEGKWYWDGGAQFWDGNNYGKPVNGMYSNWAYATPNNGMYNEDCAVLSAGTATWGDRTCSIKFAYLCEEAAP
ncbi:MAG TPA: lectin-like protein [Polyangiaceae bacterium]|nr:lectin-like protein [Polyangiaceae bacterium]